MGNKQTPVTIVYSDKHKAHSQPGHPECPDRVEVIRKHLMDKKHPFTGPAALDRLVLQTVHRSEYVEKIFSLGPGEDPNLDADTFFVAGTREAALAALGSAGRAVELAVNDKTAAFALCRPPGHHAGPDCGSGFCIFNNAAYAARLAQKRFGVGRVLIFDFDVHHGNGTEQIFYEDPSVLYISIHQHPHYPGTGVPQRIGAGPGEGYNINIPLAMLAGETEAVAALRPFAEFIHEFKADLLIFSAGFDGHREDQLSSTMFECGTFGVLTDLMIDWAAPRYPAISCLEGGYELPVLAESAETHARWLR